MKRARTTSQSSQTSTTSSGSSTGASSDAGIGVATAKFKRTDPNSIDPLASTSSPSAPSSSNAAPLAYTCSLPPGCAERPVKFTNLAALESHYSNHHAYVCSVQGCGAIFPSDHFLSLHLAEIHDPIVAVRRDNGQRTYACFVQTCTRMFSTPKKRRLHLTDLHKYPKEYFFALPKYGLQQLYSRFGDSASLVGPPRKPERPGSADASQLPTKEKSRSPEAHETPSATGEMQRFQETKATSTDAQVVQPDPLDNLTRHMEKVSFVPTSVRFGRGRGGSLGRSKVGQHQAKPTGQDKV